jgi:hypothetical protein
MAGMYFVVVAVVVAGGGDNCCGFGFGSGVLDYCKLSASDDYDSMVHLMRLRMTNLVVVVRIWVETRSRIGQPIPFLGL